MKRFLLFVVSLVSGATLFFWVVNQVGVEDIADALGAFSLDTIALLVLLSLFIVVSGIFRWRVILQWQGNPLSLFQLARLYLAAFPILFFFPILALGGEMFRAYAMKERFDVPFQKGTASVIIERILEVTTHLLVTVLGLVLFLLQEPGWSKILLVILLGVVGSCLVIVWFYVKSFRRERMLAFFFPKRKGNVYEIEREVVRFFHWKNSAFRKSFALSFVRHGLALVRTWLIMFFLVGAFPSLFAVPVLAFSYVATLVPIPAALGIHDSFQAFAFQTLQFSASQGAVFALMVRAAEFVVAVLGVFALSIMGLRMAQRALLRKVDQLIGAHNSH